MPPKVGTIAVKTSTGNQAYTVGFQPTLLILWTNGDTAHPASTAHARFGFGAAVSTSSRFAFCGGSTDNLATSDTERSCTEAACITCWDESANAVLFEADLASFDTDGFTLNFTTAGTSGQVIHYLAINGISASIVKTTTQTSTGNSAITGAGFAPTAMILAINYVLTTVTLPVAGGVHWFCGLGAASSTTARWAMCSKSQDNVANMVTDRRFVTDKIYTSHYVTSVQFGEADLASFDADGATLNWTTADPATKHLFAIFIRGGQFKVGNESQKTSTGTKATTGVGFQPEALFCVSTSQSATGDSVDSVGTIGASDGTSNATIGWFDKDTDTTSNTSRRSEADRCIAFVGATEDETAGECSVSTLDADGYTLNWQVADGTARLFGYLAFAAANRNNLLLLGVG